MRYEYIVDNLHEHLSEGQLTEELREHLRESSTMEYLLEDMDMHVSLGLGRRFHIPTLFWTRLPYFIVGIQEMGIQDTVRKKLCNLLDFKLNLPIFRASTSLNIRHYGIVTTTKSSSGSSTSVTANSRLWLFSFVFDASSSTTIAHGPHGPQSNI